jgi:hypothetical protein
LVTLQSTSWALPKELSKDFNAAGATLSVPGLGLVELAKLAELKTVVRAVKMINKGFMVYNFVGFEIVLSDCLTIQS